MPVVINTPPPRSRPSALIRARVAWHGRPAWLRSSAAFVAVPKRVGAGIAAAMPHVKRGLKNARRSIPAAARRALPVAQRSYERLAPHAGPIAKRALVKAPYALVISAPLVLLLMVWHAHSHRAVPPAAASLPTTATAIPQMAAAPAAVAPAPAADATRPSETELSDATAQGAAGLEALAKKYPADAAALVILAGQQTAAQNFEAALGTVNRALAASPAARENGKLMGILWRLAQSPVSDRAFGTLHQLGARGSDIAFDLATTSDVQAPIRERAKQELGTALAADASPDTQAATALLLAPDCATRKSLLDRAERDGGKRTLGLLDHIASGAGCTSSSEGACNACLVGSPTLKRAITELRTEHRL